jgi:hypothetical protein
LRKFKRFHGLFSEKYFLSGDTHAEGVPAVAAKHRMTSQAVA